MAGTTTTNTTPPRQGTTSTTTDWRADEKPHESPAVVTVPLMLLAIPSVLIGLFAVEPMLFGDFFKGVIAVSEAHPAMAETGGALRRMVRDGPARGRDAAVLARGGRSRFGLLLLSGQSGASRVDPQAIRPACYRLLDEQVLPGRFNEIVFAGGARLIGNGLWKAGDQTLIDGIAINGGARLVAGSRRWSVTCSRVSSITTRSR